MDFLIGLYEWLPVWIQIILKIVVIMAPLMVLVAYYTYAERKIIGYMQIRLGPNRVGPKGWGQPIADAVKLMFKEIVLPTNADITSEINSIRRNSAIDKFIFQCGKLLNLRITYSGIYNSTHIIGSPLVQP